MIRFEPCDTVIGALVDGCDLATVPDAADIASIEIALEQYGVLIFRDQQISPADQIAFSQAFAALEPTSRVSARLDGYPEIFVVGNVDGQVVSFAPAGGSDELEWHADHMHLEVPARASMLYCLETPPVGGETLFACMYSAYDALSAPDKAEADRMTALHSVSGLQDFLRDKGAQGAADGEYSSPESLVVRWPLVRQHPITGRKALYFGSKVTIGIEGLPQPEARAYLDHLEAQATVDAFRYAHAWRPGDAVLWDNRRVLHAGTPYDMGRYARRMHRTTWREEHLIT
ncbi:MAG: TauD/TfdA family dioxygenase [Pseudomonadota bacterium]